jgi:hypothetical protein
MAVTVEQLLPRLLVGITWLPAIDVPPVRFAGEHLANYGAPTAPA